MRLIKNSFRAAESCEFADIALLQPLVAAIISAIAGPSLKEGGIAITTWARWSILTHMAFADPARGLSRSKVIASVAESRTARRFWFSQDRSSNSRLRP